MSLPAFLLAAVTREARAKNLAQLRRFEGRSDGVSDSSPASDVLDAMRAERDTWNMTSHDLE